MTFHIPRVNKTFKKNQISYGGVKHWNDLEDKFKSMHWFAFENNTKLINNNLLVHALYKQKKKITDKFEYLNEHNIFY